MCITCKRGCPPRYDIKLHLMVKLQFLRMWSIPSLLPGPLWPGVVVVVPFRVPSMGQIDVFKNHLYSIRLWGKETLEKQHKKWRYQHTMSAILWLLGINNPRRFDMAFQSIINFIRFHFWEKKKYLFPYPCIMMSFLQSPLSLGKMFWSDLIMQVLHLLFTFLD